MTDPLYCNFCGAPWDSGQFFQVTVEGKPPGEPNQLLNTVCCSCQGCPVDELRSRLAEGIGSPDRLRCTFCGGEWSGLYFGVPTRENPERKVPFPCCLICHASRTDQDLRDQFHANAP